MNGDRIVVSEIKANFLFYYWDNDDVYIPPISDIGIPEIVIFEEFDNLSDEMDMVIDERTDANPI